MHPPPLRCHGILLLTAMCAAACQADPHPRSAVDGVDRCTLLADDEVAAVIGPHHGGRAGSPGHQTQYGNESCRWVARDAPYVFVELAVFGPKTVGWARDQTQGEPVPGAGGMRFDATAGELWFDCAGPGYCSLQVYTPDGIDLDATRTLAGHAERRL